MAAPQTTAASPSDPPSKPIHSLVLDTGPLIKNDPPISTLLAKAEQLYTLPSIIPEIRDAVTRTRVETQLLPFVKLRSPRPDSIKFITAFARRTGDLAVLSRPDIEVLALGYELECERNGGDWRLRNTPGQKRVNGRPNAQATGEDGDATPTTTEEVEASAIESQSNTEEETQILEEGVEALNIESEESTIEPTVAEPETESVQTEAQQSPITNEEPETALTPVEKADETPAAVEEDSDDDDGWITPSNLKKHQALDAGSAIPSQPLQKTLQAAVLTSDYAMQNVALRMNLNLVAPSLARITHLKNWVLRCHGCFTVSKDMNRQFCPSCGQPTLIRTSCSTDSNGNFKLHLKKNFQWNKRGNVYSVPKPVHGSSNGRLPNKNAGGQNGWGRNLILAEDQKEFLKAADEQRRTRKKDIMDQDYLPDLLTGHRAGGNGKIRVGAGRTVNSKKKH